MRVSLHSGQKYSFLWTAASDFSSKLWEGFGSEAVAEVEQGHMETAAMETTHGYFWK